MLYQNKKALEEPLTEAYVSFCAFTAHNFESFLLPLQTEEPMIHQLFPSMCKLLNETQSKFINKKTFFSDSKSNINIDVIKKENLKPLNLIDVGTNAKLMFKFKKDCLKFYVIAVQHLQSRLPLDIPFVKHAQFLHLEKHQLPSATSAISNLALSICSVHKTCLQDVSLTKSPVTSEKVCDLVRNQWVVYQ